MRAAQALKDAFRRVPLYSDPGLICAQFLVNETDIRQALAAAVLLNASNLLAVHVNLSAFFCGECDKVFFPFQVLIGALGDCVIGGFLKGGLLICIQGIPDFLGTAKRSYPTRCEVWTICLVTS